MHYSRLNGCAPLDVKSTTQTTQGHSTPHLHCSRSRQVCWKAEENQQQTNLRVLSGDPFFIPPSCRISASYQASLLCLALKWKSEHPRRHCLETLVEHFKEIRTIIPTYAKKSRSWKKALENRDEESTSKFIAPEVTAITTQIPKLSLEIPDLKGSPDKQTTQDSSKFPQKKQKWTKEKREW